MLLHGTTGFRDGCGASADPIYRALAAIFAAVGYVVVTPDYIGLKAGDGDTPGQLRHPYLIGEPTAMASLDAVRAVLQLPEVSCVAPRFAAYGVSQGGHAALWVDRLASSYAAELELMGVVAAVPPAALTLHAQEAARSDVPLAPFMAALFVSLGEWYRGDPGLAFAPPWDTQMPALAYRDDGCRIGREALPADAPSIYRDDIRVAAEALALDSLPPWDCFLTQNDLVTTDVARAGDAPLLYITGEADSLIRSDIERQAFSELCRDLGWRAAYLECAGADHEDAALWSLAEAVAAFESFFSGEPAAGASCVAGPPQRCSGTP